VIESFKEPVEQCKDVIVQQKKAVKDDNQIAGTVIGAVVGGVLGNQIGGGSGKKVATVAAAAAGGYAGKQVQEDMQNKDVESYSKRVCKTVEKKQERVIGYDVRYLLNGELKTWPGGGWCCYSGTSQLRRSDARTPKKLAVACQLDTKATQRKTMPCLSGVSTELATA